METICGATSGAEREPSSPSKIPETPPDETQDRFAHVVASNRFNPTLVLLRDLARVFSAFNPEGDERRMIV